MRSPPAQAFDDIGCRLWNQDVEDEADYLGGALLIPGKAARYAARADWTLNKSPNGSDPARTCPDGGTT